jgi:outer membrane protein OmpA-like peptidoglycan-associated protein
MTAPTGFGFGGWSCFDGTTTLSVAAGASYSPAANATCTAVWTALPQATFNTGRGTGTAPTALVLPTASMPDATGMIAPAGEQFTGWSCFDGVTTQLVAAGVAYNPGANASCTAQWSLLPTPAPQKKPVVVMVNNSTIVEGESLPTLTTNVDSDLSSLNCSVYSRSDKNYSSTLAAHQLTAANSPYVIHCSFVAKDGIQVVAYSDGVLNVDQSRTPGSGAGNGGGTGTHKLLAKFYFNGDSPKLRAATIAGLKKLAKKVGAKVNVVVAVQGFVKRTKVTSYDYRLSLDRALNIVAYLKKLGVRASFSADSRGIATENTAKARRAEVTITW